MREQAAYKTFMHGHAHIYISIHAVTHRTVQTQTQLQSVVEWNEECLVFQEIQALADYLLC